MLMKLILFCVLIRWNSFRRHATLGKEAQAIYLPVSTDVNRITKYIKKLHKKLYEKSLKFSTPYDHIVLSIHTISLV